MAGIILQPRTEDLTGRTFSRLTVIKFALRRKSPNGTNKYLWECRCRCGSVKKVEAAPLKQGRVQSCGCLQKEITIQRCFKHGLTHHPIYNSWCCMKSRCMNPNFPEFKRYGKRGIEICNRWLKSFGNFLEDMGHSWKPGLTIDRINNDGNYEPGNCRWATAREQCSNKRNTLKVTFNGEQRPLKQLSEEFGINYTTVRSRLKSGASVLDALTKPIMGRPK